MNTVKADINVFTPSVQNCSSAAWARLLLSSLHFSVTGYSWRYNHFSHKKAAAFPSADNSLSGFWKLLCERKWQSVPRLPFCCNAVVQSQYKRSKSLVNWGKRWRTHSRGGAGHRGGQAWRWEKCQEKKICSLYVKCSEGGGRAWSCTPEMMVLALAPL